MIRPLSRPPFPGPLFLLETYFEALSAQGYDLIAIDPLNETMTDTLPSYPGLEMGMVYRAPQDEKLVYFLYDCDQNAFVVEFYKL